MNGIFITRSDCLNARENAHAEQESGHVVRQTPAAGRKMDTMAASLPGFAHRNRPVGGPEVAEKQRDLPVREAENRFGDSLLSRALAKDSQSSEPQVHTCRLPACSVAGKEQLMPIPTAHVPSYLHPKLCFGSTAYELATLFRAARVPKRLPLQVAPVAD